MSNYVCFLISILCDGQILRCAMKINRDDILEDCQRFPMEPKNKEVLHGLLPRHIRACGPIIGVEEIFDVHQVEREEGGPAMRGRKPLGGFNKRG